MDVGVGQRDVFVMCCSPDACRAGGAEIGVQV